MERAEALGKQSGGLFSVEAGRQRCVGRNETKPENKDTQRFDIFI